jgi:hypothetical protein
MDLHPYDTVCHDNLTISQHDDSYAPLNKIKHLLVGHYVRDNV